jgi:hypothetical protein
MWPLKGHTCVHGVLDDADKQMDAEHVRVAQQLIPAPLCDIFSPHSAHLISCTAPICHGAKKNLF